MGYLNYKLKSVEHMPVKALTFKFLNTIIDDFYAFAVKTTTLYRISCFKDDVIFVIFIFQMFIYRNNKRVEDIALIKKDEKSENEKEKEKLNGNENKNEEDEKKKMKIKLRKMKKKKIKIVEILKK